jgi:hypothetical protein
LASRLATAGELLELLLGHGYFVAISFLKCSRKLVLLPNDDTKIIIGQPDQPGSKQGNGMGNATPIARDTSKGFATGPKKMDPRK